VRSRVRILDSGDHDLRVRSPCAQRSDKCDRAADPDVDRLCAQCVCERRSCSREHHAVCGCFASPVEFLPNLEGDQLDHLRHRFVILASGEGAWENIGESWHMASVLGAKGIPNRVDNWGRQYDHDWATWHRMLPQYLRELI
jgi:hypothetical protein